MRVNVDGSLTHDVLEEIVDAVREMDLVEFGGVFEVGVFRCVVVIPVGFSSEAEYIYIEKGGWLVDVFFYLFEVRGERADLTRQDSEFDERHRFFLRRILLNQKIRDIGRLRKDLFLEQ